MNLKEEKKLIKELKKQSNWKPNLTRLSKITGIPTSTIWDILDKDKLTIYLKVTIKREFLGNKLEV